MAIQAHTRAQENLGFALGVGTTHQGLVMEDAYCGFNNNSLFLPQQQKQNLMMMQSADQFEINLSHYKNQNTEFGNGGVNMDYNQQSMASPQIVSAHIEKQRIELDRLISLQGERLRQALQEQRKNQLSLLLNRYESKARILIQQKDEEISMAAKKTLELQDFIRRMEMESRTWQRLAKENEEMVRSLNDAIEKLRENARLSENVVGDAESCCLVEEDNYQRLIENDNVDQENTNSKMFCRCCNNKTACVISLPCRHLCLCKDCESLLDSCPVCKVVKKSSIDALF